MMFEIKNKKQKKKKKKKNTKCFVFFDYGPQKGNT